MKPLLRIYDVAEVLQTNVRVARRWLEEFGVRPIDLGRGRGLGLRWQASDIQEALNRARVGEPSNTISDSPSMKTSFFARSPVDVLRDLGRKPMKRN